MRTSGGEMINITCMKPKRKRIPARRRSSFCSAAGVTCEDWIRRCHQLFVKQERWRAWHLPRFCWWLVMKRLAGKLADGRAMYFQSFLLRKELQCLEQMASFTVQGFFFTFLCLCTSVYHILAQTLDRMLAQLHKRGKKRIKHSKIYTFPYCEKFTCDARGWEKKEA